MPVIRAESAPRFALPGLAVTGLAAPSRGSSETSVWRLRLDPDMEPVPHALDREEIFVGLSGHARVKLGAEELELGPGDALIVPAGTTLSLSAHGAEAFEAVAVAPVGMQAIMPSGEAFAPPWTE